MNLHPFDILPLEQGGGLIFTPCPGTKGVDLQTSVAQLEQAGASAIVTLMPETEMARFEVAALPSVCAQHGLQWFHLPVEDDMAPTAEFQQRWEKQQGSINRMLDEKRTLAIHCRGGSGRTGLMAAIILLGRGIPFERVVSMVQALRPNALKLQPHVDYLTSIRE